MSLAQHVTRAEGFDYERPTEQAGQISSSEAVSDTLQPGVVENNRDGPQWRRLSFAPIESVHLERPIAAYKVSNAKRWGTFLSPKIRAMASSTRDS